MVSEYLGVGERKIKESTIREIIQRRKKKVSDLKDKCLRLSWVIMDDYVSCLCSQELTVKGEGVW